MISNEEYQLITKDISGARTKNRFFYEMLYGVKLIYDLYLEDDENFFVVFDYACDIETSKNDTINFYQLKTKDGHYTLPALLRAKENEKSILQTLINLNLSDSVAKLVIVSNNTLHGFDDGENTFSNVETFCFDEISDDCKTAINESVSWPNNKIEFNKLFFVMSDLCLKLPSNSLKSYTNSFLNRIYPESPLLINRFEQALVDMVKEKATYELDTLTLDETVLHKGITRDDMKELLNGYSRQVINSSLVSLVAFSSKVDSLGFTVGDSISIKQAFSSIFGCGYVKDDVKEICTDVLAMLSSEEYRDLGEKEAIIGIIDDSRVDYKMFAHDYHSKLAIVLFTIIKG